MKTLALILVILALTSICYAETLRSPVTVRAFKRVQPCPANGKHSGPCPGWVADHVLPLGCNGPDTVANLQWQTSANGKLPLMAS
jgi:hypothetical protein